MKLKSGCFSTAANSCPLKELAHAYSITNRRQAGLPVRRDSKPKSKQNFNQRSLD